MWVEKTKKNEQEAIKGKPEPDVEPAVTADAVIKVRGKVHCLHSYYS